MTHNPVSGSILPMTSSPKNKKCHNFWPIEQILISVFLKFHILHKYNRVILDAEFPHVCMYAYMSVCMSVCLPVFLYVCISVCLYACMCVCVQARVRARVCVCVCEQSALLAVLVVFQMVTIHIYIIFLLDHNPPCFIEYMVEGISICIENNTPKHMKQVTRRVLFYPIW